MSNRNIITIAGLYLGLCYSNCLVAETIHFISLAGMIDLCRANAMFTSGRVDQNFGLA